MRKINKIIIHCTATPEGREVSVETVIKWHKNRGFKTIGYHYLIHLDGTVSKGRNESEIGAHCKGQNKDSLGVCYVGGLDESGKKSKDTRTPEQKESLVNIIKELRFKYPEVKIYGHYNFANKKCPSFKTENL